MTALNHTGCLDGTSATAHTHIQLSVLTAVLRREVRAALLNRYLQIFSALALLGGIVSVTASENASASSALILQLALYFVSLFAVLAGVSSARAEGEEWPLLFAQPMPRGSLVIGKFIALWMLFGAVLVLLFAPFAFTAPVPLTQLGALYFETLGLAAIFGSIGLCAGFLARDRAQGLILGVSGWLLLLVGIDLLALFAAQWPLLQKAPNLWVGLLMLNPLDAFRIQALFALEQIPAEAAEKTPLARWWINHAGIWFAILAAAWSAVLLWLAGQRLCRWEE